MQFQTLARSLLLGLMLFMVPAHAEARKHHEQSTPIFDRHAVHSVGSEAVIGERAVRKLKRAGRSATRTAQRHHRVKDQSRVAAPKPKPGTLGAYRKLIADEIIGPLPTKGLGNIQGLKPHFIARLAALRAAMPVGLGFSVGSGFRSHAEQARLHALKPRLAARPGRSNHERGLAGDLKFASGESSRWLHRNASRYGLRFPMSYEPWHIEPVGATRYAAKRSRRHHYAAAG